MKSHTHHVKKRYVCYVPGFDPRGASVYHRFFASLVSNVNDKSSSYTLGPRKSLTDDRLIAQWTVDASDLTVDYHFLSWDDIVRSYWPKSRLALVKAALGLVSLHYFSGGVRRIFRLAKGPGLAAVIPFIALLMPYIVALITFCLLISVSLFWVSAVGAVLVWGIVDWAILRSNIFWLLRIYNFVALWGNGEVKEINPRIEYFSQHLKQVLEADYDEVLLVGHSIGAMLLIKMIANFDETVNLSKLKVLTLGHSSPVLAEMPSAGWFRQDIDKVANFTLPFFDVTSAVDGASFYGVSPLYTSDSENVVCLSARFHTMFSLESYRKIRYDWYRIHFQYLMPVEKEGLMDYLAIVCGTTTLETLVAKYPESHIFESDVL